ncbi:TRAP transporter small permease [Arsenicitalea aurantiaca]|uniref:TRAP transporter small permease protein n=1 Tax=Arsenicitalea aurantiaca TaxID=1783274 RepID=A0A433XLY0_9HYPH|nr:TRAP transporter small permease [Arsenicitalea aurantiaca]RUT35097.1 TRAP transporter small permease [Arsenicitalea aurantiaca]
MKKGIDYLTRGIEVILVLLLASMAVMVFANVVMRYGFNSGLAISEEMSRFFFVWLTFIGAVVTFKENGHLGVETLVRMFGRRGRMICMALTNALIIMCAVILFWGTWLQQPINASVIAPVSRMPMIYVFGVTYFAAVGIGIIAAVRLFRVLTNTVSEAELRQFAGEYDDDSQLVGRSE